MVETIFKSSERKRDIIDAVDGVLDIKMISFHSDALSLTTGNAEIMSSNDTTTKIGIGAGFSVVAAVLAVFIFVKRKKNRYVMKTSSSSSIRCGSIYYKNNMDVEYMPKSDGIALERDGSIIFSSNQQQGWNMFTSSKDVRPYVSMEKKHKQYGDNVRFPLTRLPCESEGEEDDDDYDNDDHFDDNYFEDYSCGKTEDTPRDEGIEIEWIERRMVPKKVQCNSRASCERTRNYDHHRIRSQKYGNTVVL